MPQPVTTEEQLRLWAESCPLAGCVDYQYAEVTVILHQARVVGVDVRQKYRYSAPDPPNGGDSDRIHTEPSDQ